MNSSSSMRSHSRIASSNYFGLLTPLIRILIALSSTATNQILATIHGYSKARIKGLSCKLEGNKTRQIWRIGCYKRINSVKQIENSEAQIIPKIVNNFSRISDLRLLLIKQKRLKISKRILAKRKKIRFNRILKLTTIRSSRIMILMNWMINIMIILLLNMWVFKRTVGIVICLSLLSRNYISIYEADVILNHYLNRWQMHKRISMLLPWKLFN